MCGQCPNDNQNNQDLKNLYVAFGAILCLSAVGFSLCMYCNVKKSTKIPMAANVSAQVQL